MRTIKIILTFLLIVIFPLGGYGETGFNKIYGLRDRDGLERIINEAEKINPSDKDTLKLLGIAYHNLATLEVKGASDRAVEYLERAYKLSPEDYEVLVYLGSAKTMVARDSWNVVIKVSGVNKGINMMDKAVRKSPDNIAIKMVRANNSLKLPKFFKRRDIALKDFQHLERLINKSSLDIDADLKAEVFYQLGMLHKEENKSLSMEYFKKAVNASPDSKWGIEAKAVISKK